VQSGLVEFRLLQLLCNPVGDERVTVALIHWDGRQVRFAWNRAKVPSALAHVRSDVQAVLGAIRGSLRSAINDLHLAFGLDHVYQVPEGHGSLLVWGPLRVGVTGDPQAHYSELVKVLDLHVPGTQRDEEAVPRAPRLARQLSVFGKQLLHGMSSAARGSIRVRHTVRGLREYESPLSWMNGRWHHSFPLSLAHVPAKAIVEKYEKALGRIDVSIPRDDVGFIVAVSDRDSELQSRIADVESFIRERFGSRVDCMSATFDQDGAPEFEALAVRVEHDVMAAIGSASTVLTPPLVAPLAKHGPISYGPTYERGKK
jgi:hypothetical protein